MVNGNIETIFLYVFNDKIVATALLVSLTAFRSGSAKI